MPRSRKRPADHPKRPVSGFIEFLHYSRSEFLEEVKVTEPPSVLKQVAKLAKAAWEALPEDERRGWTEPAAKKLEEYKKAAAEYRIEHPVETKSEDGAKKTKKAKKERARGVPKRTASAYVLFAAEKRSVVVAAELAKTGSAPTFAAASTLISNLWKPMNDTDRAPWVEKATRLAREAKEAAAKERLQDVATPAGNEESSLPPTEV